jgi:hypothetical protein
MAVKVQRKRQCIAKLRSMAPALFEATAEANRQTADEAAELARVFVEKKSGKTRDSIVVTGPGGTPPSYSQGAGRDVVPPGAYAVSAGNENLRTAHLTEWGTQPHFQPKLNRMHPGAAPHPFFWPAMRIARRKHKGRVTRRTSAAMKRLARK